ncbi:adenylate/guanylate cyclase domain-containing protein [Microvirga puerhi]|uniref:Adenylate/guanylate cyclase domain-containing protein n=1 Tax=Microvirga puerhi TaxID=2876078 RepID=A0ABS7VPF4_9HYPH|nr:adenylate/guanylate cyclase domain-containing protein [Microvirga puerhi]MBZ6077094.1 adenylate/guanylate cyclase domain-containing protein [Microvirga puerhi]
MTGLETWIIEQGLSGSSIGTLLTGFAERLSEEGIPLARAYIALPTVNPTIRVFNHTWIHQSGTVVEGISHERNQEAFEISPFGFMLREGLSERHWRFDRSNATEFAIFDEIRSLGGTDYLGHLVRFENAGAPDLRGIAVSFSSLREGGLTPEELARIAGLMPLLSLAAYRIGLFDLTVGMLDTYVGLSAGRRVLSGEIRRGSGATVTAALLFADLRGFTALADQAGAPLIARLDEHLEAMAAPVVAEGGEILKFLGDGLLATFAIDEGRSHDAACAAALQAAVAALELNAAVNVAYPDAMPLSLDIALHSGDVFYGNIGAGSRLDFTVIGPAVNEVSRMEALCGALDCALIMSATVAAASPLPVRSLGPHRLRGVPVERELFTLT